MKKRSVAQKRGIQKNKLLRYRDILNVYMEKKTEDIPCTVIWRKYIYPKFYISRTTLYTILGTPVTKELKKIEEAERQELLLS
jgi:hypothetical protein